MPIRFQSSKSLSRSVRFRWLIRCRFAFLVKSIHELRELVDTIVYTLHSAVDNVDAVVAGIFDQLFHVAAEARQVGGD